MEQIQPVLHARVEETLSIINDKLVENAVISSIDGGILLTGGMTYIPGIKELATKVFGDIPVKIANPRNIQNGYINFNTPTMSTIVGLILYELDCDNGFELTCNGELRQNNIGNINTRQMNHDEYANITNNTNNSLNNITEIKNAKDKDSKKSAFGSIFDKLSRWI